MAILSATPEATTEPVRRVDSLKISGRINSLKLVRRSSTLNSQKSATESIKSPDLNKLAIKSPNLSKPAANGSDYWNVNMPSTEWTVECPEFLRGINADYVSCIRTPLSEVHLMSWDEVKAIIASGSYDFTRGPLTTRFYMLLRSRVLKRYKDMGAFIVNNRLAWPDPSPARGAPFEFDDDTKIVFNDLPYDIDPSITHLLMWMKYKLPDNEEGWLREDWVPQVEAYIKKRFIDKGIPEENLIWFRNPLSRRSIPQLDHVQLMIRNPDPKIIQDITRGYQPLSSLKL